MNYNDLHLVYNRHMYDLPPAEEEPAPPVEREPEVVIQQVIVNDPALEARCKELERSLDVCAIRRDRELEDSGWSPDRFPLMHIQYAAGYAFGKFLGMY